jgi:hypothetical protein
MSGKKFLQNIARNSKPYLKANSATILTCLSALGVVATSVLTVKATVKAVRIIDEAECVKKEDLNKLEVVKATYQCYIPAVLVGTSTMFCIFGANVLNKRQQASLISAYTLVDNSFKEYKNKLKELYGEETHNNVINALAVEKAAEIDVWANGLTGEYNLITSDGEPRLFYEEYSGRYFESTIERVMNAEYHLNRNYVLRGDAALNELYEFLGLEQTDYGYSVGWSYVDGLSWIDFNHRKTVLEDGLECYILEMPFGPSADYLEDDY